MHSPSKIKQRRNTAYNERSDSERACHAPNSYSASDLTCLFTSCIMAFVGKLLTRKTFQRNGLDYGNAKGGAFRLGGVGSQPPRAQGVTGPLPAATLRPGRGVSQLEPASSPPALNSVRPSLPTHLAIDLAGSLLNC